MAGLPPDWVLGPGQQHRDYVTAWHECVAHVVRDPIVAQTRERASAASALLTAVWDLDERRRGAYLHLWDARESARKTDGAAALKRFDAARDRWHALLASGELTELDATDITRQVGEESAALSPGAYGQLSDAYDDVDSFNGAFKRLDEDVRRWDAMAAMYDSKVGLPASVAAAKRRIQSEDEQRRGSASGTSVMDFLKMPKSMQEMFDRLQSALATVPGYSEAEGEGLALRRVVAERGMEMSLIARAAVAVAVESLDEKTLLLGARKRAPPVAHCFAHGVEWLECAKKVELQIFSVPAK